MMGRPTKPTAVKALQGTLRKCRENRHEPRPDVEIPDPPADLDERALEEWNYHAPILAACRVLTRADRNTLACYCVAAGRRIQAEEELKKTGPVVKSPSGFAVQNPWLWVANKSMDQMLKLGAELGLSPASRSRIKTTSAAEPAKNGRARFFRTVG